MTADVDTFLGFQLEAPGAGGGWRKKGSQRAAPPPGGASVGRLGGDSFAAAAGSRFATPREADRGAARGKSVLLDHTPDCCCNGGVLLVGQINYRHGAESLATSNLAISWS
jgi:hypothetical protein